MTWAQPVDKTRREVRFSCSLFVFEFGLEMIAIIAIIDSVILLKPSGHKHTQISHVEHHRHVSCRVMHATCLPLDGHASSLAGIFLRLHLHLHHHLDDLETGTGPFALGKNSERLSFVRQVIAQ